LVDRTLGSILAIEQFAKWLLYRAISRNFNQLPKGQFRLQATIFGCHMIINTECLVRGQSNIKIGKIDVPRSKTKIYAARFNIGSLEGIFL